MTSFKNRFARSPSQTAQEGWAESFANDLERETAGKDPAFEALLSALAHAPARLPVQALARGERAGEHVILEVIGRGGFGTVYRAMHPVLRSQVAIKVLNSGHAADSESARRFVEEARAIHRIRHKNIVELLGFGELPSGQPYYTMELLEGCTLTAHIAARGAFDPAVALHVLQQIAEALDAAHAQGVLHRDLKPDNVFVIGNLDLNCQVKLLDFGIAKLLGNDRSRLTGTGTVLGTPGYMSPEQCGGEVIDAKSDIYTLGVVAFELLAGQELFPATNVRDAMSHHLFKQPRRISEVCPWLPAEFDAPLLAMLDKRAERRPAMATGAVRSLAAGLSALPVEPSRSARKRHVSRRRGLIALAAVSACLVALQYRLTQPGSAPAPSVVSRPVVTGDKAPASDPIPEVSPMQPAPSQTRRNEKSVETPLSSPKPPGSLRNHSASSVSVPQPPMKRSRTKPARGELEF